MNSILSNARQNAPMKNLFLQILCSRVLTSPGALGFLVRCFGDVCLVDEANMLFDQVTESRLCVPNIYWYKCLLEAIVSSNRVDLIEMRLKETRDHKREFDKYTFTPILQVYRNAERYEEAFSFFKEAHEKGLLDGHMCSALVLSLSKNGAVDIVIEVMENLNVRLNEKTFHVLIHGFMKESSVDRDLQLFDIFKQFGYSPNILLYDALIGGLFRNKEPEKALRL